MNRWIWAALALAGCAHGPHGTRHTDAEGDTTVDLTCSTREDCEADAESLCGGPVQSIWTTRNRVTSVTRTRGIVASDATYHDIAVTARCQPRSTGASAERGLSSKAQTPAEHGSWMAKSKVGGWCAADSTCESDLVCKHGEKPDADVCVRPAAR